MGYRRKKCSIRKCCCMMFLLVVIAIAGGVVVWQYLTDKQKLQLAAILDNGIPFVGTGDDEAPPPSYNFNQCGGSSTCCNGLPSNCGRRVDEVLFAGLHNAHATAQDGFLVAPNHQYNLISGLDYGYRVLNIDVGVCDNKIKLLHGRCQLGTSDPTRVFEEIHDWMDDHPNEVILIPLQMNAASGGDRVDLGRLYNLLARIPGFTSRLYQKQPDGSPWPTLEDMIEFDRRVVLFHYNGSQQCYNEDGYVCPPGFHDWFAYAAETTFSFVNEEAFDDKATACRITRGRPRAPFFGLNLFTSIPSKSVSSSKLNTESFLKNHIQACSNINGGLDVNIVFVDFFSKGALPKVVQEHNRNLA